MSTLKSLLVAAAAAAFVAPAVMADSASRYSSDGNTYYADGSNDVIVRAPRRERSRLGAPIETVYMQREVYFGDLNLRSHRGAAILKARIDRAANRACTELDDRYPITAEDSPDCVALAKARGYRDADYVISQARGY